LEALPPDLAIRAEREIGLSDFPREP
jgi:hypothetical protein